MPPKEQNTSQKLVPKLKEIYEIPEIQSKMMVRKFNAVRGNTDN